MLCGRDHLLADSLCESHSRLAQSKESGLANVFEEGCLVEDFSEKRDDVELGELVGDRGANTEFGIARGEVGVRQNCLEVNISPLIGAWGPSHFIVQVVVGSG